LIISMAAKALKLEKKYFLTFFDYIHYTMIYLLKSKYKARCIKRIIQDVL